LDVVPSLSLTFDDGPDPRWTPKLLDRLASLRARAMFFPIASRAAEHPQLIARMLADGHTVGLHCDEHVRHSARDIAWLRRDTSSALDTLSSLGVRPSLWRTPWGDLAPWSYEVAEEHALRLIGWTVDTHDWRGDTAAEMFAATRPDLGDGAVILAHDGIGPGARRTEARETIEFVGLLARYAAERGLVLDARA
jgi:peptidoglycan/xylan/chitin deacetylase (PgdA/CDA1 family)